MSSLVQSLVERWRSRSGYVDPGLRYTAEFAPPWRRGAAAAIDWTLCLVGFLLVSIPLGAVQALAAVSWEEGDLGGLPGHVLVVATQILTIVPAVAYFAVLLPSSQTLGMRALELHAISVSTGRGPSRATAIVRGAAATLIAAGVYLVYQVSTSYDRPKQLDDASAYALDTAYVLAGAAAISALTMIISPTRRSLLDRLFGTAVLHELEAVAPRLGPWGPLDAFDLSSKRDAGAL